MIVQMSKERKRTITTGFEFVTLFVIVSGTVNVMLFDQSGSRLWNWEVTFAHLTLVALKLINNHARLQFFDPLLK